MRGSLLEFHLLHWKIFVSIAEYHVGMIVRSPCAATRVMIARSAWEQPLSEADISEAPMVIEVPGEQVLTCLIHTFGKSDEVAL